MSKSLTPEEIEDARKLLTEYESKRPDVVSLAMLSSLARRIEPEVLRELRLELADRLDEKYSLKHRLTVATEAALWFSPLLESRGPDNITLLAEFSHLLRERLKEDQELLDKAHEIIDRLHQSVSPVILWEEDLVYLSLRKDFSETRNRKEFDRRVLQAIKAIETEERPGLEQWIMEMGVRLPKAANLNLSLAYLHDLSSFKARERSFLSGSKGASGIKLDFSDIPTRVLEVQMVGNSFRLGFLNGNGQYGIKVPDLLPIHFYVLQTGDQSDLEELRVIPLREFIDIPVGPEPVKIRTIDGKIYLLDQQSFETPPVSEIPHKNFLRPSNVLKRHKGLVWALTITPDNNRLISGSYDGMLMIWDLNSGKPLRTLEGHTDRIFGVSITSDGRSVISCSADRTIKMWDLESGDCLGTLKGHELGVYCVAAMPDGHGLISGSFDHTLMIWHYEKILEKDNFEEESFKGDTGKEAPKIFNSSQLVAILKGHTDSVFSVAITTDGRYAVSASADRTLRVWDLETKECTTTLIGHSGPVDHVAITRDGNWIISGSRDKTVRIWNLESGKLRLVLKGHDDAISGLTIIPNGLLAITSSFDKTMRFWDLTNGTCEESIELPVYPVNIAITSDLKRVILSSDDNDVWLWDIPANLIQLAERRPDEIEELKETSSENLLEEIAVSVSNESMTTNSVTFPIPHQIPSPPPDLTGRDEELKELAGLVEKGATVIGLRGMGGVGKTALAYSLAEKIKDRFPDGQLFVNMMGARPLTPAEAMGQVIRSFYPEVSLPENEAEIANLYRSILQGKRALMLLDNVLDEPQARPLIPPSSCLLVITSRYKFSLPGLIAKDIFVLRLDKAAELLQRTASENVQGSAGSWEELARLCGCLPVALRAAAGFLANTPGSSPEKYIQDLHDERKRLGLIGRERGEEDVVSKFSLSYGRLEAETARVFREISVFPSDFDALAEEKVCRDEGHTHLNTLLRWSLVEYQRPGEDRPGRYHLHDLIRLFAIGRLAEDGGETARNAAFQRHALHYRDILKSADDLYKKGEENVRAGLKLFDLEWINIQAGWTWVESMTIQVNQSMASETSDDKELAQRLCISYLTDAGDYVLSLRSHPYDQIRRLNIALVAARRLKDRKGEGAILGNLGIANKNLGETQKSLKCHKQSLAIEREIGNRRGEGNALSSLGMAYKNLGEYEKGLEFQKMALAIAREIENRRGEGTALNRIGMVYKNLGEYEKALEYHEQALAIAREIGNRRGEGTALNRMGIALKNLALTHDVGMPEERRKTLEKALEFHEWALTIAREIRDRRGEGAALCNIGSIYRNFGEAHKAIEFYEQHLAIAGNIGDRRGEGAALGNMGVAYYDLGSYLKAIELQDKSLAIAREIGDRRREGNALWNKSLALDKMGERKQAIDCAELALEIRTQIKSPFAEDVRRQLEEWKRLEADPDSDELNKTVDEAQKGGTGKDSDQREQTDCRPQTDIEGNVQGSVVSGQVSGPVAMGGEAVDMRGSASAIYKPEGPVFEGDVIILQLSERGVFPQDLVKTLKNLKIMQIDTGNAMDEGMPATSREAYERGMALALNRDYGHALDCFRKAVQLDKTDSNALYSLAWFQQFRANHYIESGDYDSAKSRLKEAHEAAERLEPIEIEALLMRGYILLTFAKMESAKGNREEEMNYLQKTEKYFKWALEKDPSNVNACHGIGDIERARGNTDAAIEYYDKCIRLLPSHTVSYIHLFEIYEMKIRTDQENAEEWCKKALEAARKAEKYGLDEAGISMDNLRYIREMINHLEQICRCKENTSPE